MESAGAMSMVMPRDAGNEAEHGEHQNERRRWHEEHEKYGGSTAAMMVMMVIVIVSDRYRIDAPRYSRTSHRTRVQ